MENVLLPGYCIVSLVFLSTHFWGPVFNWMIPIAALSDTQKHPRIISGKMTLALALYSMVFMRFAVRVQPRNLLLFACHCMNTCVQLAQGYRFVDYHYISQAAAFDTETPVAEKQVIKKK